LKADLVVAGGTIYTMDLARPVVEALAIAGERIVAVGEAVTIRDYVGPATQVVDLAGSTAIPGLTDAHVHFVAYGLSLQQVDLAGVRSPGEAVERVRARAAVTPAGEWLHGRGWDRNLWSPAEFPNRWQLDAASPVHPVVLRSKDLHALWLNSLALRKLGLDQAAQDTCGGQILRDAQTGEAAGVLLEEMASAALQRIGKPGPQTLARAIVEAAGLAHRLGLTGVHDCEEGEELAAFLSLRREGTLPLRVYMLIPRDSLDAAIRLGLQSGLGDDWLRIGHLKVFADGSLGSHTADMLEPYDGEETNRGIGALEGDALRQVVERASGAGIAVATHAIGDRANRRVLDAYAATRPIWARQGLRPRIEHAQLLADSDLLRLAQLGVVASMQPVHATSDWEMAEAYWGPRVRGAYAWRSLLEAGTVLAFGSDCPVETLSPLAGIYAAVTRQRPDGSPAGGWQPQERVSVYDAVRAYTWGAAYAAGEEARKGSLTPGKVADLVVLSDDIFKAPPETLLGVQVLRTICGGRVVFLAAGVDRA